MRNHSTLLQILLNLGSGWLSTGLGLIVSLLLVPFLLHHLGTDGYGLIGLVTVITSLTTLADLGLRAALARELSEQAANNDKVAYSELITTSLVVYVGFALIFSTLLWALAPILAGVFKIPAYLEVEAIRTLRTFGVLQVLCSFVTPVFTACLASHHRYDLVNFIQGGFNILTGLAILAVLPLLKDKLNGWMWVSIAGQILTSIVSYQISRKHFEITRSRINFQRFRSLARLGGSMYVLQLTQLLAERSDPLVISYFNGPAGVALYNSGMKVSQSAKPVVLALINQIMPLTTRYHVQGLKSNQQKLLLYGTKFTLLLGSLIAAGTIALAEPFCKLWLGPTLGTDYHIVARIMVLWALADLLTYAAGSQFPVLLGMKRLRFLMWTQLPSAFLNIALSIYLVGFTNLGIESVLYATILINLFRRPILIFHTASSCGVRVRDYLFHSYLGPLLVFVLTLVCGLILRPHVGTWFQWAGAGLTIAATWLFATYFLGVGKSERSLILSKLPLFRNRISP